MRARYYDPKTAAFVSRDPLWPMLADVKSLNPYAYANQNPLRYVDPSGLRTFVLPHVLDTSGDIRQPAAFDTFVEEEARDPNVPPTWEEIYGPAPEIFLFDQGTASPLVSPATGQGGALSLGGFKIADAPSPAPQDRVFLEYGYYQNLVPVGKPASAAHSGGTVLLGPCVTIGPTFSKPALSSVGFFSSSHSIGNHTSLSANFGVGLNTGIGIPSVGITSSGGSSLGEKMRAIMADIPMPSRPAPGTDLTGLDVFATWFN
jgi:hypothetical protein